MKKIQYDHDKNSFFSRPSPSGLRRFCALSLLLLGLLSSVGVRGQTTLYRSAQDGNWNATATWEVSTDNGVNWAAAAATPTNANSDGITIRSPHTVTVTTDTDIDQTVVETGAQVNVNNNRWRVNAGDGDDLIINGTVNNAASIVDRNGNVCQIVINGTLINATGGNVAINQAGSTLTFASGSTYEHAQNGGTVPAATWDPNSNCLITGITGNNPGQVGQTFGNFIWNCAGQTQDENFAQPGMAVAGNFEVVNTSSQQIQFNQSLLNIGGDLIIRGGNIQLGSGGTDRTFSISGDFVMSAGSLIMTIGNNEGILNIAGDLSHTGGTITETGNGTGEINFTGTVSQSCTISGTLSNTINFTISAGAAVSFGATDLSGSTGTFNNNGAMMGTGPFTPVSGGVLVNGDAGAIAPGASPGTLSINGDLTSTGTLSMEIEGTDPLDFDQIIVSGQADITGTLEVDFGTYVPPALHVFLLIDAGSYVNGPATVNIITPHAIDATYNSATGELTINSVLPIQLVSFTGERVDEVIELKWRTESEENNDYMLVERSADAFHFEEIGRVNGAGTTTEIQDYTFTDKAPLPGANYYRLRQVDMDGREEIHPVIHVDFIEPSVSKSLKVYPNPAVDNIRAAWAAGQEGQAELRIFSSSGQLLSAHRTDGENGTFELPLQHLPAGTYILQLTQGNKREVIRFVKK